MKMMKSLCVFAAAAALTLTGCTTTPEGQTVPDIARIAAITQEAATIGTQEALTRKPEWKAQFNVVVVELTKLEAEQDITVESLLRIISQLPVDQLSSPNARLAFSSARLLVAATGWATVPIVRSEQLRPVVRALRDGMANGGAGL